jgi:hypothetical protein
MISSLTVAAFPSKYVPIQYTLTHTRGSLFNPALQLTFIALPLRRPWSCVSRAPAPPVTVSCSSAARNRNSALLPGREEHAMGWTGSRILIIAPAPALRFTIEEVLRAMATMSPQRPAAWQRCTWMLNVGSRQCCSTPRSSPCPRWTARHRS